MKGNRFKNPTSLIYIKNLILAFLKTGQNYHSICTFHPLDSVPHLIAVGEDLSGDDAALDVELGEEEERAGEEEAEAQRDPGQKEGLQTGVGNSQFYKIFFFNFAVHKTKKNLLVLRAI